MSYQAGAIIALTLGVLYTFKSFLRRPRAPLPPGPRGLPIIGNLFNSPSEYSWIQFAKWGKTYGDIVHTSIFNQHIIFLNSYKAANEVLIERSIKNSDRPSSTFSGDMVGWSKVLVFLNHGETFRRTRKFIHQLIGTKASVSEFSHNREIETRRFLVHMLEKPDDLYEAARIAISSFILRLSHGYAVDTTRPDPMVELAHRSIHDFTLANEPGAILVDSMPILRFLPDWAPFTEFKAMAREHKRIFDRLIDVPFEFVRQQMALGKAQRSFTSVMLEEGASPMEEELVKWTAVSLDTGGIDTSVATICTFFLAMVLFPEVQKRAQAEIDATIGPNKLPNYDDNVQLPYVWAILREVVRWNPPAPVGTPHKASEDDIYRGYLFPKGATVVANVWAMCHDPEVYTQPSRFNPERFMGENPEFDPFHVVFGFGRRACPGRQLAEASLFTYLAMILATFNISKARDERGNEIQPEVKFVSNLITHPAPFKYDIKPRSPAAELLIRSVDEESPRSQGDALALPKDIYDLTA